MASHCVEEGQPLPFSLNTSHGGKPHCLQNPTPLGNALCHLTFAPAPPPGTTNRTEGGLPYPVWQYLLFVGTDVGWVCGTAGLTGVLLLATLLVMVLCSLPCIRRRGLFEVHTTTL